MIESKNLGFELQHGGWVFNYFYGFSLETVLAFYLLNRGKNESEQNLFYQQ